MAAWLPKGDALSPPNFESVTKIVGAFGMRLSAQAALTWRWVSLGGETQSAAVDGGTGEMRIIGILRVIRDHDLGAIP